MKKVSNAADTEASVVMVLLGVKQTPDPDQSGNRCAKPDPKILDLIECQSPDHSIKCFQFIFLAAILLSYLLLIIYNTY